MERISRSSGQQPCVYAILRSYNTSKVLALVTQLSSTGMVDHITVVINSRKDRINTVTLLKSFDWPKPVLAVPIGEYGWSQALNAGLRSLPPPVDNRELVMMVSNEVEIMHEEVESLIRAARLENASCGYALFRGRMEPTYQLPRNTFIIWKRRLFGEIGLFDQSLDNDIGMEDYDMVLRAFESKQLLPFLGCKNVSLKLRPGNNLAEKLGLESRGVAIVEQRHPIEVVSHVRTHIQMQNGTQTSEENHGVRS